LLYILVKHTDEHSIRPKIIVQPSSKYTLQHNNLTLKCVATSSAENDIEVTWWYHDVTNHLIKNDRTSKTPLQLVRPNLYNVSSLLHLTDIKYKEKGKYWCIASNLYGSDHSHVANLTVAGKYLIVVYIHVFL
jgi:Immunoglobulin C1-set domain.